MILSPYKKIIEKLYSMSILKISQKDEGNKDIV